jgi:type IV fimbrial biogenesis protein FimT
VVIAVLAGPAFNHWLLRDRADQMARSLLATFTFARNESLRLGARIDVCRDDGTAHCAKNTQRCGSSEVSRTDNWACGWLVTVDARAGATARLLRSYPGNRGLAVISPATMLSFTPPAGQVLGNFRTFELSPAMLPDGAARTRLTRCIRLAVAGRPRLTDGPCAAQR